MKKIVPFTKDLIFKTKIGEITSIELDNNLVLENDIVFGEFIINGTYKMLEGSMIEEEFKYNIPVDITIDSKYETRNCSISIDDFSYEIINEEKLKVNISVMLDDLDIKDENIEKIEVIVPEEREETEFSFLEDTNLILEAKNEIKKNKIINQGLNENNNTFKDSLLEKIDSKKEYSIYRVYTYKEDDTLELIYEKFNTTKEILSDYNDLDNISIGCKLIIPSEDE